MQNCNYTSNNRNCFGGRDAMKTIEKWQDEADIKLKWVISLALEVEEVEELVEGGGAGGGVVGRAPAPAPAPVPAPAPAAVAVGAANLKRKESTKSPS